MVTSLPPTMTLEPSICCIELAPLSRRLMRIGMCTSNIRFSLAHGRNRSMAGRAGQAGGKKGKEGEKGTFYFSTFPGEEAHLVEVRMG